MPEVEDVGPGGEGVKDALDRVAQRLAAGDQRERIEIALHGQVGGQLAIGPHRIDRLVEPDGIDPRLGGIGAQSCRRRPWESR